MTLRKTLIAARVIVALLVVNVWPLDPYGSEAAENVQFVPLSDGAAFTPIPTAQVHDWPETLANYGIYLFRLFASNKELLLYGIIAMFGILMVALALTSASSSPQDKSQQLLELLKQEKQKAEELAKLKSEFLNQVSHELRTPLAVVLGYVECLTDGLYGDVNPKHLEILHSVAKQSSHLKNMIDQILIFSRLESSKQPLRADEFSIHTIFADLRDTYDFLCEQKGIDITWNIPRDLPPLRNDPDRFKDIANNLLGNALKYTDSGYIRATLAYRKISDSHVLEVADSGVGIPESYLSTIFEPFIQVHKTSTGNSRGGIGLGLSIVKKHVEQMGGTITVESEVGKGTTFTAVFPRVRDKKGLRRLKIFKGLKLSFGLSLPRNGRLPDPAAHASARSSEASPPSQTAL